MRQSKVLLEETNEHKNKYKFTNLLVKLFMTICIIAAFAGFIYFSWQAGQSGADWFFRL
ncbi:hypothetical protein Bsel_0888 [[Bacillus] selenitireducens MLS10]|uniref:Uncharacterized protein n=1 Tax=Bacillus selenitireducens (strain ATCC 700615 / DSM 15326 / MLS10) TaxID=439292 RepID=D6XZN7_BACIE|nr:hypothetical protein Bsel_0888 [[Bacillus] selenitireducens MLS10]